ncbi:iron donor protein CyaY [Pendulispora brunnea]|uniref:Iron-sulfur cluster assembly protein CyaY n=1 Tax=Pendulispora brunnea TaxID=2905690 RepID=A0ABZ2KE73_9BACT
MSLLEEPHYQQLADSAFRRIEDAFQDVDPEEADCERAGDVVTILFRNGTRCIVNTQRPTRQIWLAANARAWHFSYEEATSRWLDDKGTGAELFATLGHIVKETAGVDVTF